jgi:hypothetical protein
MAQAQRVKTAPTPIEPARPSPEPAPTSGTPWLVGVLIGVTVALLALAGWTVYQRYQRGHAEDLARGAIAAWDSAKPSDFAAVYDPNAVVFASDGTKITGLDKIEAAVGDLGPKFSMNETGGITVNGDGSYATAAYRYAGNVRGTGVTIMQISDGKIVRQWNYDVPAPTPAKK